MAAAAATVRVSVPYVLFVGRLERKKNITTLIEVFARARQTLPALQLVLIGAPGVGWSEAEQRIQQFDLDVVVHRLGWQPRQLYVPLLAGAAALVFLSRYEGFGLPVLESFAVGTPVIAAAGSALPEVAGDGAIIVNPDDADGAAQALVDIIQNYQLRQTLNARARRRLGLFSWSRAAQATHAVLEQIGQSRI
jgi:glycosyltransferase involved in cell wall biosynthesis